MPQPAGWQLAAGRPVSNLLFVTCSALLHRNIGAADAVAICAALGASLFDLPLATAGQAAAVTAVQQKIAAAPVDGVVLVGGPDVVPQQRLDVLTPALAVSVNRTVDLDEFIVWSDDSYGAIRDGALPSVPVTRIPDASSAALLWTALAATGASKTTRSGIRNVNRPFADGVWTLLPGPATAMPTSAAIPPAPGRPYPLASQVVYLMLHGIRNDGTRFDGETATGNVLAMDISEARADPGSVVFTGCCWGALTATATASATPPGAAVTGRSLSQSIALAYLSNGSLAFVGCTGAHWSPLDPPYAYNGGPMHQAFFRRLMAGEPPALALFRAKYLDYGPQIPHPAIANDGPTAEAIERKVLFGYTCLGLGW